MFFFEESGGNLWLYDNIFILIYDYNSRSYEVPATGSYPEVTHRAQIVFRCMIDHVRIKYFDENYIEDNYGIAIPLYKGALWFNKEYNSVNKLIDSTYNTIISSVNNLSEVSKEFLWNEIYSIFSEEADSLNISEENLRSLVKFDELYNALIVSIQ